MSNTAQNYTIPVVGHFEKVSLSQFKNAIKDEFDFNRNIKEEII